MRYASSRRSFLRTSTSAALFGGLAELDFLAQLPAVSAAEATPRIETVRFSPEIEPLVRLIEDTPRERLIEVIAERIKRGLSYQQLLAAIQLAGVRSIEPRPVGFKFHAVLVVNSAHLASLASPDEHRWLPIFWTLDKFKSSQADQATQHAWSLPPARAGQRLPRPLTARQAFIEAIEAWDADAADAAIISLARSAGEQEVGDLLFRYGARDFRDIGHKPIFVANSRRTLDCIGWQHAEPILRSLVMALLEHDGTAILRRVTRPRFAPGVKLAACETIPGKLGRRAGRLGSNERTVGRVSSGQARGRGRDGGRAGAERNCAAINLGRRVCRSGRSDAS